MLSDVLTLTGYTGTNTLVYDFVNNVTCEADELFRACKANKLFCKINPDGLYIKGTDGPVKVNDKACLKLMVKDNKDIDIFESILAQIPFVPYTRKTKAAKVITLPKGLKKW